MAIPNEFLEKEEFLKLSRQLCGAKKGTHMTWSLILTVLIDFRDYFSLCCETMQTKIDSVSTTLEGIATSIEGIRQILEDAKVEVTPPKA